MDAFYTAKREINDQYEREKEAGKVSVKTAVEKSLKNDYLELMTQIRQNPDNNVSRGTDKDFEPYLVGLAREALGREPLEDNPSPFKVKDLPKEIEEILVEHTRRKAKSAMASTGSDLPLN
jgi:hypothetical protein